MTRTVIIPEGAATERLDMALVKLLDLSRSQVQKLLREGLVEIGGMVATAKQVVLPGTEVTVAGRAIEATPAVPNLTILYEDADLLMVDKPADLAVHATETGRVQPTVAAFAAAHGVVDEDTERPGIVHRLDKDTSGVMVLAKNPAAKAALQAQFKQRTVAKTYLALVRGHLAESEAIIRLPIGRHRTQPVKRAVLPGGRPSETHYRVLRSYDSASLIEVQLHTGRTHQIRVHLSHLGHPVVGDTLYGERERPKGLARQFLHATKLGLTTPGGEAIEVTSPLPPDLEAYLQRLETLV